MQEQLTAMPSQTVPFQPELPLQAGPSKRLRKPRSGAAAVKPSKKSRILELYRAGTTDIGKLARAAETRPSYVASVLQAAGLLSGYFDLYTTTAQDQNLYSRFFRNALNFKTVESARESVSRIAQLYAYFERLGDRAGQHHAEVLALTGRNRARWSGKKEEARIFEEWLFHH